jgi:hypothetical protein
VDSAKAHRAIVGRQLTRVEGYRQSHPFVNARKSGEREVEVE